MLEERYSLAMERIRQIQNDTTVSDKYKDYFESVADFILMMDDLRKMMLQDVMTTKNISFLQKLNHLLYEDILPENYEVSYANPRYAVYTLGEYGQALSFVYSEIRGLIVYTYENRIEDIDIAIEFFLEVYNLFSYEDELSLDALRNIIYWYISDYSDVTVTYRIREQVDCELTFATDIIMNSNLSNIDYLYKYGEYITENEIKTVELLNSKTDLQIEQIARTFTEGYRLGFVHDNKDLSKKDTVNIRYQIGFEKVVRAAIRQFEEMGLKPVIYRYAVNSINKRQNILIGYSSTQANKQYNYDHRFDNALYVDKALNDRKLAVVKAAYEMYKDKASKMSGPACMEVYGEYTFVPEECEEALKLTKKQESLQTSYYNQAAAITNEYIKGEERSFTIICYPVAQIGDDYEAIFNATVDINNLDRVMYERIQEAIINALDNGETVSVTGRCGNETNITVALQDITDKNTQTKFENCLADVNIPLGEVFTSPRLKGTNGLLHVKDVYIEGMRYLNLKLWFKDGVIEDYSCTNFDKESECKAYIKENILFNHDTLPMGEFAIGTNTQAYAMANKYKIMNKMPILIAEKMGPHFAVGDTCYSFEEDVKTYNSNKKEIVAKDNEFSKMRNDDITKAYFNCHTDITIPYRELDKIVVNSADRKVEIISNGEFVLEGTEELNKAL